MVLGEILTNRNAERLEGFQSFRNSLRDPSNVPALDPLNVFDRFKIGFFRMNYLCLRWKYTRCLPFWL